MNTDVKRSLHKISHFWNLGHILLPEVNVSQVDNVVVEVVSYNAVK